MSPAATPAEEQEVRDIIGEEWDESLASGREITLHGVRVGDLPPEFAVVALAILWEKVYMAGAFAAILGREGDS